MVVETSKIDALLTEWDTTETPGCVLAAIKDGARCAGLRTARESWLQGVL